MLSPEFPSLAAGGNGSSWTKWERGWAVDWIWTKHSIQPQSEAKVIVTAVVSQNKKWAILNSNNFCDNTEDGIINLGQVKGAFA